MTQLGGNGVELLSDDLFFEQPLANASARLTSLAAEQVDSIIQETLLLLCEHPDLDRSLPWQRISGTDRAVALTHFYQCSQQTQLRRNIVQGALNNALRHGHASNIQMTLQGVEYGLQLRVDSGGAGFDPAQSRNVPSLGLASMRERSRLMGGEFYIESEPDNGTNIISHVPS